MKTNNVANAQNLYNQYKNTIKPAKEDEKKENELLSTPVDTYKSSVKGAADPDMINRLWNETNQATAAIRKLVMTMLGKDDASGQAFWAVRARGGYKLSEIDLAQVK